MPETILKVNNLSKCYRIGMAGKLNRSLRETITDGIASPFRNFIRLYKLTNFKNTKEKDVIWALKDISFDVKPGEVLGIIGKNGSGKSTLLKILSRITEPSLGSAEIRGKVSSLLEVGTGFHAELTGRENIFLNGAILGMRRQEIVNKFNDIVDFSEIGKHIDTPVKRYSSGMYVRLAFAVAAHLDPEIMLLDEVLAVGDAEFQKKCLGKMSNLAGSGRTVLFVSHNMASIKSLCHRTILLDRGRIVDDGPTEKVVKRYLGNDTGTNAERIWGDITKAPGNEIVRLKAVRAKNAQGKVTGEFSIQEPIFIEMEFEVLQDGWCLDDFFRFYDESGSSLFTTYNNQDVNWHNRIRPIGLYRGICHIPANFFNEGNISVWAAILAKPNTLQVLEIDAINFHMVDPGFGGTRGDYSIEWPGDAIRPMLNWTTEHMPHSSQFY